jgi:transposase
MDRKTVRKWLDLDEPPSWSKPPMGSVLDPHAAYLKERWAVGCRDVAALRRELATRGCVVKRTTLDYWIRTRLPSRRDMPASTVPPAVTWKAPSMAKTAWLLQERPANLKGLDACYVEQALAIVPDLTVAVDLVRRLAAILRKSSDEKLEDWLSAAASSPLNGFAAGLTKDRDAVQAAIDLPWSTSPVEGQISRLKLVKRSMYGRGGFELLRHRVMLAA